MLSLNFKDCHTKIRHVDAHATLNDGVVVQVMGELSNNMQPVRRFMQTFVLAPEVCFRLVTNIDMKVGLLFGLALGSESSNLGSVPRNTSIEDILETLNSMFLLTMKIM